MKLNDPMTLPLAGRYSHPGDPGEILPIVVGNFLGTAVNSSDPEAGGMLPAVLIDVPTWTYCLCNGRTPAGQAHEIYVEDIKQSSSVYTINVANDFQGQGLITTATFTTDPGGRRVGWRGHGLADGTGALITNPITAIQHVFTTYGNWLLTDFDPATIPEATRRCTAHSFTIHWCFNEHRTYKEWLTDLMAHYFGDVLLTHEGRLALVLDEVLTVDPSRIMAQLSATVDLAGDTPEDAVEWDLDRRNLCNTVTARYRYAWSRGVFTDEREVTQPQSLSLYGSPQPKEMLLPGIRTEEHLDAWTSLFLARYSLLPAMVRFPVKTLRYLALMPSNYVTLSWRWGPEATGAGWLDRILKVLNVTFDLEQHETQLECLDTGLSFEVATYALLQDSTSTTWYLSVEPDGTFQLGLVNPGVNAVDATTWSWIRLVSPDATVSYVRPNTAGGTWLIAGSQPAGSGTTAPVILVSRQAKRWRLSITNAPATVFFLEEPRRLPFGGQTVLISTIGQFRLDFNVLA